MTSTSTPKDIPTNTKLHFKQKSTIKPDIQLKSNLFGYQNNATNDIIEILDREENELHLGKWLPPSVNQRTRKKDQNQLQNYYSTNNTNINSLTDNREPLYTNWEQKTEDNKELKDEKTAKVTNHTNKLINNLEHKFIQINRNIERKQEEALGMMFDKLNKTLEDINRQSNIRIETRDTEKNSIQKNRQSEIQTRRNTSITTGERETTVTEPHLPIHKQLASMSINEEPQIEQNVSSGSVPTRVRPIEGTDPAYTVEEYLNNFVAAMIFSSGIEPINKPGHHQLKVKRAALILHTLQAPAQKWYSTLPSETKLDWETLW